MTRSTMRALRFGLIVLLAGVGACDGTGPGSGQNGTYHLRLSSYQADSATGRTFSCTVDFALPFARVVPDSFDGAVAPRVSRAVWRQGGRDLVQADAVLDPVDIAIRRWPIASDADANPRDSIEVVLGAPFAVTFAGTGRRDDDHFGAEDWTCDARVPMPDSAKLDAAGYPAVWDAPGSWGLDPLYWID